MVMLVHEFKRSCFFANFLQKMAAKPFLHISVRIRFKKNRYFSQNNNARQGSFLNFFVDYKLMFEDFNISNCTNGAVQTSALCVHLG
eukprot:UN10654